MKKIYDSSHQAYTINNWKKHGLICREGETYKDIYSFVMSVDNCNLCNVKFNNEINSQMRCMDHDHATGHFRQVLCMKCNKQFDKASQKLKRNNKLGHMFISRNVTKNRNGNYSVGFRYERKGFKRKGSQSLTKLIALSFIHLLKEPI